MKGGGGVGANSREPMSVVFFFKYSFYAIVCLFMLEKSSFIYTFFYNNCIIYLFYLKYGKDTVRHVTGNDKDYLRKIPRVVW